ncbi:hypothetical protein RIR_jg24465.t1 [Rhizophagus irregularis DAOM 181602=DAOM 197198]|nr:hypothetical protein RIR_jg24465.t1 [Rhizophagus irregularis DAOM 181602=DAOM 197198]
MGSFGPKFFISVRMNSTIFGRILGCFQQNHLNGTTCRFSYGITSIKRGRKFKISPNESFSIFQEYGSRIFKTIPVNEQSNKGDSVIEHTFYNDLRLF